MPVPKGKQALYGKVVGKMINSGKSVETAKKIADKAVKSEQKKNDADHKLWRSDKDPQKHGVGRPREYCAACGCKHESGWH